MNGKQDWKEQNNLSALQFPVTPTWDPDEVLKRKEEWCIEQGFDLEDPGYIEYMAELKRFLYSRCQNTYGDCEITMLWGQSMQPDYEDVHPEIRELHMFQSTMIFIKPDQILTDILEQCNINNKEKIGILVSGNVKDTKKDELTKKQIEENMVVLSGVKPRSKYIQIWVDEPMPDIKTGKPFSQDHLKHLKRFPLKKMDSNDAIPKEYKND